MKQLYSVILLAALFVLGGHTAQAQGFGTISGRVLDDQNLALPGANVVVTSLGTRVGSVTDAEGYFAIYKIPAGSQTVEASYIGYETFKATVQVEAGKATTLKVNLKGGVVMGVEVVVLGDRLKGQAKAMNEQRNNTNITNVVAADQIGRFPDANIGDALKRIPGFTVINDQGEARFGVIRGTEPRFNSVMLNGERVPSAESDTRTVQLDLIPSDMIATIQVNKAVTPDLDADAIGGAANLVTRSAPSGLRLSATAGSGYNFLAQKPMTIGSLIVGKRFLNDKLGVIVSGSWHTHLFGSDNAEFVWNRDNSNNYFLSNYEVRRYDLQRIRRSGSVSLDYRLGVNSVITLRSILNVRDDYENRYRLIYSGLTAPNATTGLSNGRFEIETKGGGADQKFARLERQTTTVNSIGGEHLIANRVKVNWSATYSYAEEARPNERYISFRGPTLTAGYRPNVSNPEFPFVAPVTEVNYTTLPFRRTTVRDDYTNERDANGLLNVLVPLNTTGKFSNSLKMGLRYRYKEKYVRRERGELRTPTGGTPVVRWSDVSPFETDKDNYLANGGSTRYRIGPAPGPESLEGFEQRFNATNMVMDAIGNAGNSFQAYETISGGYAMLNQNLGEKLFLLAGIRLENTNIRYNATTISTRGGQVTFNPTSGTNTYLNVMPGLHLKYDVGTNTILRAAWTNTLARPNYVDLAPIRNIDINNNTIATGNPDLKATTAMNFDIMAEHYFKSIGVVSGGVFYKDISNFIYTYSVLNFTDPIDGNTYVRATQPRNGSEASLFGFEVAFQRQLDFLPGFLKGLGVYANYTYNNSQVKNYPGREGETLALPGTATHNYNASLSYESKRVVARISLNGHSALIDPGEAIIGLSNGEDFRFLAPNLYLDANASYAITPKFRLFVELNNLTNQPLLYYQGVPNRTMQAEYYNVRAQFGLKFDFFGSAKDE
jgi:TonB-dependent receptor